MAKDKNVVKVQKIGNSYMITLTKDIIKESGIKIGDEVDVKYYNNMIVIKKINNKTRKSLLDLAGCFSAERPITNEEVLKAIKEDQYEEKFKRVFG
jgi:antitoxin component of MazEF toxin-antitoxin module